MANPKTLGQTYKRLGVLCLATGGFSGYFPVAPGTAGSVVALLIVWGLFPWMGTGLQIVFCGAALALGVWVAEYSRHHFKESDPKQIVIDEIVGLLIAMVGIPVSGYWLFWAFVLFRLFDIVKIPPANFFDARIKNGWGIVLDDVVSGLYVNLVLHLMWRTQI